METIYFGAGCFWGVEELFRRLDGVEHVTSGYTGGELENPSYEDICTGRTGHAEVVKVDFNREKLSLKELYKYFFKLHDPTTLNRQGYDIGTQYRSVIFYQNNEQKEVAQEVIQKIDDSKIFKSPIVTELTRAQTFYPAEDYHQEYYLKKYKNGDGPLCHFLRNIDLDFL